MLLRPALAAVTVALLVTGCGSDDETKPAADSDSTSCTYADDGQAPAKEVDLPSEEADGSGTVQVALTTSAGDLGLELDAAGAPCTVNSFVSLAKQGYYDDTPCHRLTTASIFVLQCGDPTGTGLGGPGYTIPDEVTGDETYPAGTLAMARTKLPNSGGSQFFLVYEDTDLPPDYTVFGTVDDAGLKVLQQVADLGTADGGPDGPPKAGVTITSVTVED